MEADDEQTLRDTLQSLCLDCGMCCDGTLFECVELEPEERAAFDTVGLIRLGEKVAAPLPCPKHCERRCTIYEQRPTRCIKFTCKLYEGVSAGSLAVSAARERIAEAQRLFGVIEAQLGWLPGSFSTTRFRSWAAGFVGGESEARQAFPTAFLKYGLLRVLMERHFMPAPPG